MIFLFDFLRLFAVEDETLSCIFLRITLYNAFPNLPFCSEIFEKTSESKPAKRRFFGKLVGILPKGFRDLPDKRQRSKQLSRNRIKHLRQKVAFFLTFYAHCVKITRRIFLRAKFCSDFSKKPLFPHISEWHKTCSIIHNYNKAFFTGGKYERRFENFSAVFARHK